MQLRRALPLTLAALVLACGCVTVHPVPAPQARHPAQAAAPAGTYGRPPETPEAALPLVDLPVAGTTAAAAADPTADGPVPAPPARPAAGGPAQRAAHPPRGPRAPRTVQRAQPARTAPRAKVRRQPAVPGRPRPAPGRSYDMAPLCAAARGTVSPAIVALCR